MNTTEAKRLVFGIHELRPLISWPYFYYAWGMSHADNSEKKRLRHEAEKMLDAWEGRYQCKALVSILNANSSATDDIIIGDTPSTVTLPMLRQQKTEGACLCLADYIRPVSKGPDTIGIFATSMDAGIEELTSDDPYTRMMAQTLADRLAEATSEKLGTIYPGIRPAVGYPVMPDMSLNFLLDELIHFSSIGITLTENGMMIPHASISGLIINHPQAEYFVLGAIGDDQLLDYSRRRKLPIDTLRRFIR